MTADASDVDHLLHRAGVNVGAAIAKDAHLLVGYLRELGATDDEIVAAAPGMRLGSLALDLALRVPGEVLTLEEFLEQCGDDADLIRRLWVALGFPVESRFPFPVTADLGESLRVLAVTAQLVGVEPAIGFARVVGSSLARLADALAATTRVGVEVPQRETGMAHSDIVRDYTSVARDLLPTLWDAMGTLFRRHIVLVSYQQWDTDEDRAAVTYERTIGFADLVGSTAVLRELSTSGTAALVDRFEQLVWDLVTSAGGRVVKLIGDEAMFVFDAPERACVVARELVETSPDTLRIGLAHGEVVALRGDFYGPTVNLAARLVAVAPPSTVLVSQSVHDASTGSCRFDAFDTPPLRGFADDVRSHRLV